MPPTQFWRFVFDLYSEASEMQGQIGIAKVTLPIFDRCLFQIFSIFLDEITKKRVLEFFKKRVLGAPYETISFLNFQDKFSVHR